jgi:hypothetical protein
MQRSLFPLASLLFTAGLLAQPNYTVTPRGVDLIELNSSSSISLNWTTGNTTRVQQADNAHLGNARVLRSIAWRRNGTAAKATTWTPKLDILFAHADFSKYSSTFASNYKTTPVTVFSGTQKLDWTKPSPLPVGLWSDATFPFKAPFVYNGKDALLWETRTFSTSTTSAGYSVDWQRTPAVPATRSWLIPQVLGTGCTTKNGRMTLSGTFSVNSTPTYSLTWNITNTSSSVPVRVYIGLTNPNRPLLCSRLHTEALLLFPPGSSNASGRASLSFSGPWTSALIGVPFSAQALAFDISAPWGGFLSNGLFLRLPKAVGGTPFAVKRMYSTSSVTATTGTTVTNDAMATQLK